jgi:NADH-quinone oxidoreductase subunit J
LEPDAVSPDAVTDVAAGLFALLSLLVAALALSRPQVVHAAFLVMLSLLLVAAAMLLLSAGLAAALMILVHAGAIVAVLLFVAVTLPAATGGLAPARGARRTALLVGPAALLLALGLLSGAPGGSTGAAPDGGALGVGERLFGPWAIAVELASLLLLVALLGARLLLRRDDGRP